MKALLQDVLQFLPQPWRLLAIPAVVFLAVIVAGLVFRRVLFARLHKWARSTTTRVDETLLDVLHGPMFLWIVILAIYAATDISELPPTLMYWAERALLVLWIVSLTIAASRLAGRFVLMYSAHKEGAAPAGTLSQVLASILVGSLGVLMLMRALGVDITAFLATLGVGGLAVALALQDTLSNFFAGFYLSIAGQIRVGDFIQLESGQRGYVTDIGWRATTLRERSNNLIVIPNNKLSQSILTNFHLPEHRLTLSIQVGVGYDADPDEVEAVLLDVARNSAVPGLLQEPAPVVLLMPGFGDRSLDFTLVCQIADYEDQFRVQHELRKAILKRFREEKILIPFVVKTVESSPPPIT